MSSASKKPTPADYWLKGILLGLAFFIPGIIIVKNAETIRAWMNGMGRLPVVLEVSRDFQTGLEVAGELFLRRSDLFYRRDTLLQWTQGGGTVSGEPMTFAWRREAMEAKLEQVLGSRRGRGAERFLDYIERYRSLAEEEMIRTRVPASIKLAQGILESDGGDSYLARSTNNHFGIKCLRKKGGRRDGVLTDRDFSHHTLAIDCFQFTDDHEWDRFEVYRSVGDSYRRHSLLLTGSSRYNWMTDAYRTGQDYRVAEKWFGREEVPYYAAWSIGLKENGYATSKRYAQKLAYVIETYELWRIDYEVVFTVP